MKPTPIPAGRHRCSVVARRGNAVGVEILVEVVTGRYAGRRIRFAPTASALLARAELLVTGQVIDLVLRYKREANGGLRPVVMNFYDVQQPTVVQLLGGAPRGDGGAEAISPIHYDSLLCDHDEELGRLREVSTDLALTPSPIFSKDFANALCRDLADEEKEEIAGDSLDAQAECESSVIGRAMERAAMDHPLCLIRVGDAPVSVEQFEPAFTRFCRAEDLPAGGRAVTMSAYQYGRDLSDYMRSNREALGEHRCPVWSRWIHMIFRAGDDPEASLLACRRFVSAIRRLAVVRRQVLVFTLGNGDLEVMFPAAAAGALPRPGFEFVVGYLCQLLADWSLMCPLRGEKQMDFGNWWRYVPQPVETRLYAPLATVAMPNTPVGNTGNYKVRVSLTELESRDAGHIASISSAPRPFNPPEWQAITWRELNNLWVFAVAVAVSRSQSAEQITFANRWVYPGTFDFMCFGTDPEQAGERLYAAAMNLLDFACPVALLEALLAPAAVMSGLPTAKVKATLDNAIRNWRAARPLPIERVPIMTDHEEG